MIDYTDILRVHSLKATPQRLAIANILQAKGHISIESLYAIMLKKFTSISLATIYKNINLMLENSFIEEVKILNSKSVYELSKDSHSHLVCDRCGNVEDIIIDLESIIKSISQSWEYEIRDTNFILSGICKECK